MLENKGESWEYLAASNYLQNESQSVLSMECFLHKRGALSMRETSRSALLRWLFPILMLDLHLSSIDQRRAINQIIGQMWSFSNQGSIEGSFNKSTSFMLLWNKFMMKGGCSAKIAHLGGYFSPAIKWNQRMNHLSSKYQLDGILSGDMPGYLS